MFFPPIVKRVRLPSEDPVASGEPVPSGGCSGLRRGSHGDASTPKKSKGPKPPRNQAKACKEGSKKTKKTKQRLTKKEQDDAAIQRFLSSQAFTEALTMQLDKLRKSDRMDKVYKRAFKVMRQFAFLADGDPEAITEEGDLLLEYIGKMNYLQCKRKGVPLEDLKEVAALNEAFSRLKHVRKK